MTAEQSTFYETFFIERPADAGFRVPDPTDENPKRTLPTYRTTDGRLLKWSAEFPLPEVGQRIYITMNGIGWAIVKGYFESGKPGDVYLGVMTQAAKPPKWLRDQRKRSENDMTKPHWYRAGIGCEFGAEIELQAEEGESQWLKRRLSPNGYRLK